MILKFYVIPIKIPRDLLFVFNFVGDPNIWINDLRARENQRTLEEEGRGHAWFRSLILPNITTYKILQGMSIWYWHRNKQNHYQFNSVAQSCLTLCDPMDCSMPSFPIYRQLLELAQTRVHWVGDAIQPLSMEPKCRWKLAL